jgi:NAD(P)-dependent dehydrogenase (short-subunit alcohol dehydrogenase family)
MSRPHDDTAALIVGGTQGLGLAIAAELHAQGCRRMVLSGRDADKGQAAAATLGATFLPVDLADTDAAIALVDRAAEAIGPINALVNAAALTDRGGVLDTTPALWDEIMTANLRSPFFTLQRVAQRAIDAGHPASIVNILSMMMHCGLPYLAPYSASKAAMGNVTRNAANALAEHRIRVNGIALGWMDSPGEDLIQRKYHGAGDDWLEKAEAAQPFGMLIKPAHVAGLAAHMLSPASGVMTGAIVDFDQKVAGAYAL